MASGPQGIPQLLSLAVHEFRTPMTIVAGYLRMLLRDRAGALTDTQRKLVEEAEKSSARLAALISELSDIANLEAGTATFNRVDVPVFPLVAEAVHTLQGTDDRPLTVEIRGAGDGAIVHGDATRLRTAFAAIAHAVVREQIPNPVLIADCSLRDGDGAPAAVILLGAPDALEALGDAGGKRLAPFDEYRGGTGLGLPIARRVIEAHEGRLWAPSGDRSRTGAAIVFPVRRGAPLAV